MASRAQPSSLPHAAPGTVLPFFFPLLVDLHPVPVMTPWPLATPPPPPSLPHPGMVGSSRGRASGMGVPQCQRQRHEQPVAASSTPGGWGTTPAPVRTCQARRQALLALGCLNHLAPRPRHDASPRGASRPHRLQDSGGPPPVAGPPPPCSSQAADPRGCHPLTPAASSSDRCACMVL